MRTWNCLLTTIGQKSPLKQLLAFETPPLFFLLMFYLPFALPRLSQISNMCVHFQLLSLKKYWDIGKFSRKMLLNSYLKQQGIVTFPSLPVISFPP